jgi:hypothetical protein
MQGRIGDSDDFDNITKELWERKRKRKLVVFRTVLRSF